MRIGILHQYGLRTSGSGVYAERLGDHLRARGHQVCLVSRSVEPEGAGVEAAAGRAEGTIRRHALLGGPGAVAYPRPEMPYAPTFAHLDDEQLRAWVDYHVDAITEIARKERLDVLHANQETPMAFVAHEVRRRTGIPYIVVAHGSTLEYVHAADERYAALTRTGLEGAGRVVALTTELRRRLLGISPSIAGRLEVVAAGVDLDVFRPAASDEGPTPAPPTVLFVGRLALEKGPHALIAAFPRILRACPDAHLRIVGEGPRLRALMEMTDALAAGDAERAGAALGAHDPGEPSPWLGSVISEWTGASGQPAPAPGLLAGRVTFVGRLDPPAVAEEMRRARLVVVPSLVREAFPLVTLEGLACGIPPVCADHGGLAAVLDQLAPALGPLGAELRVPMGDAFVADLATAVVRVLQRLEAPADRKRGRARCRALAVDRYGWPRVAADLESQYLQARSASGPPDPTATW